MYRILIIDDEPIYHKMVAHALKSQDYQVDAAINGQEGLKIARLTKPDLIISDVNMPDISGYDVARSLRRDPQFAQTPILILTSQAEIQDKLLSFEAGADDHVTKPFEPAELVARVGVLIRRAETIRAAQQSSVPQPEKAKLIAVHSLRGGIGCSSLAANLAIGLSGLWNNPALLLDLALMAGQVALMLNSTLRRTWADIAHIKPDELDINVMHSVINKHESGLEFIAAPTNPAEAEILSSEVLSTSLGLLCSHYQYIVADVAHDFSELTLQALDAADTILLVLAPDMASIRAGAAALDTYHRLKYNPDKIKLILNWTFPRQGISRDKIETALSQPISLVVPFVADRFVEAINLGQPLVYYQPNEPVSGLLEDFAFHISKEDHKKVKPSVPGAAWKRVYKRFSDRKK